MISTAKKEKIVNIIGKILISLSVISFFCGDLSIYIGFTLKPLHIIAFISLIYLLATYSKNNIKTHFSRIDKVLVLFWCISFLGALLSPFSVLMSLKHILGIALLFSSFYIFKILYCRYDANEIVKIISLTGIFIILITLIWYAIGLFALDFNFNIKDVWCFGVRVDRKIPRLISFAYDEPNYVSIYFSILFAYYLSNKRNAINLIGLIGTFAIIILTMSRGGYVALFIAIIAYLVFSKEKLKKRLLKIGVLVATTAFSFACMSIVFNTKIDNSNQNNIQKRPASIVMIERFSKSFKDNGSNRLIHWEDAIETFKDYPLFGIGPGNIIDYNKAIYKRESPTHNSYLDTLAEQGIIGSLVYLFLLISIILLCWKIRTFTIAPTVSFIFLFVSELFLSLTITDMLLINILILDIALEYQRRKNNYEITNPKQKRENSKPMTNSKIKVSFIVPVYNVENYLKKCLDSLVHQSGANYEIILINDGSTDNSSQICKEYAKKNKQIKYYEKTNGGLSSARNYGIKKAKGEYIWFIDSDDFISENSLEIIKKTLSHDIVTIEYFNYYNDYDIDSNNNNYTENHIARYLINPALAPLKIIRRKLIVKNNLYFAVGKNYEDIGIMYSIINYTDDVYHSNERLYFYRRRPNSISSTVTEKRLADHVWAITEIGKELGKNYDQEIKYQILLQILFVAFDTTSISNHLQKKYFNILRSFIKNNLQDYRHNKYLSIKTKKNLFYKIYLFNLTNKKYSVCKILNGIRKIIVTKG